MAPWPGKTRQAIGTNFEALDAKRKMVRSGGILRPITNCAVRCEIFYERRAGPKRSPYFRRHRKRTRTCTRTRTRTRTGNHNCNRNHSGTATGTGTGTGTFTGTGTETGSGTGSGTGIVTGTATINVTGTGTVTARSSSPHVSKGLGDESGISCVVPYEAVPPVLGDDPSAQTPRTTHKRTKHTLKRSKDRCTDTQARAQTKGRRTYNSKQQACDKMRS